MAKDIKVDDSIGGYSSLGVLWDDLAKLTTHISEDNKMYSDGRYPVDVRSMQLTSVKALLNAIEMHHK